MRGPLFSSSIGGSLSRDNQGDWFRRLASKTSYVCGRPATFALAVGVCLVWGISGPIFRFSDTWQLVINTGTTIITFLMVFLIQATQNRDTVAIQLKLDELLLAVARANNKLVAVEDLSDAQLGELKEEMRDRSGE